MTKKEDPQLRMIKFLLLVSSIAAPTVNKMSGISMMYDEADIKTILKINTSAHCLQPKWLPDVAIEKLAQEYVTFVTMVEQGSKTCSIPKWLPSLFLVKHFNI